MSSSNSMHIIIPLLSNSCNESLQENIVWTVTTSIKLLLLQLSTAWHRNEKKGFFIDPFFSFVYLLKLKNIWP